jgi:protein XagA
LAAALAATPATAQAGAWTLPQGRGQIIETFFGWLGQGPTEGVPKASRESKAGAQTYVEYGLADRLTLVGEMTAERYALSPPTASVYSGLGYSGGGLRVRLWSDDAWVYSLQATALASGATQASAPAQAGNTGPEADLRALVGRNLNLFGAPAYVDAQAGYRFRTEGPPSEWHADLTLGVALNERTQALAQMFTTISNGAGAPGFPAWASHKGQLSVVYALDETWSLQVGGFGTLYRRNTNSEYGAMVAVWRRF